MVCSRVNFTIYFTVQFKNFGVIRIVTGECGKWYSRVSHFLCYGHRLIVNRVLYFVAPDILSGFIHPKDTVNDERAAALSSRMNASDTIYRNIAALGTTPYYVFFAQNENTSDSFRSPVPTC